MVWWTLLTVAFPTVPVPSGFGSLVQALHERTVSRPYSVSLETLFVRYLPLPLQNKISARNSPRPLIPLSLLKPPLKPLSPLHPPSERGKESLTAPVLEGGPFVPPSQ